VLKRLEYTQLEIDLLLVIDTLRCYLRSARLVPQTAMNKLEEGEALAKSTREAHPAAFFPIMEGFEPCDYEPRDEAIARRGAK
jgi:hypothetical protein